MNIFVMLMMFAVGLLAVYLLCMVLYVPLKWLLRLVFNSIIGFAILALLNVAGGALFGFTLPLNLLNVLIAGALGVPGVILLVIIRLFL